MAPQSEGPEGHVGLSLGLAPYTVPVDAMKCVIILRCCLDVGEILFIFSSLLAELSLLSKGRVCGLHKIFTQDFFLFFRGVLEHSKRTIMVTLVRPHLSINYLIHCS